MLFALLIIAAGFVAFSNGANDNFKGVATIYGSGTAGYKAAMTWATVTTFAGSVASIFLAQTLLKKFSGKGLVPDTPTGSELFVLAVAIGAGLTVVLATRLGFPISTTHSILGALIGAGLATSGAVNLSALGKGFVTPLLLSPVLAVIVAAVLYGLFHAVRHSLGVPKEWCICVGTEQRVVAIPPAGSMFALRAVPVPTVILAEGETIESCGEHYAGTIAGIDSQKVVDLGHFLSAGIVSFARGLNDTPKIAALALLAKWLTPVSNITVMAVAMGFGGLLGARRIAETMGHKITSMNVGQGVSANIATAILVVMASLYGLPVSTTHVSVGSLFGIGVLTRQANIKTITAIILSWVITLPVAAVLAAAMHLVISQFTR